MTTLTPTSPTDRAVATIMAADHFTPDWDDWIHPNVELRPDMLTGHMTTAYDWDEILSHPWSPGLSVALEVAADIYSGSARSHLSDVLTSLDRDLQERVLRALRIRCGLEVAA